MKTRSLAVIAAMLFVTCTLMSFVVTTTGIDVPEKEKSVKNPIKADAKSVADGKTLYMAKCKMCHGEDGAKSKDAVLNSKEFKANSDGAVFYKTNTGKGKMPAFKEKLKADEVWNIVNFMRSL